MVPTTPGRRKSRKKKEPKIPWKDSDAKKMLYKEIMAGLVPLEAPKDDDGQFTEPALCEIYAMQPEYAYYDVEKFLGRLSLLRKTIKEANTRAKDYEEAFNNYKQNHQPSAFSHKGCINWQGSDAQVLLLEDIEAGKLEQLGKKELWGKRPEYYECFPLPAFRD
jgi:hypothetical protein